MAKFYTGLNPELSAFIRAQHLFFTASATDTGRINLSPKGLESLRVLSDTQVAYLDLTGSGAETAAHLIADGRLTLMFCSLTDAPLILRLYGQGQLIRPGDPSWEKRYSEFSPLPGARQIVLLNIESVQTSCGFGVPLYEFQSERAELVNWAVKKGERGLRDYRDEKNQRSIDGLEISWED